MLVEKEIIGPGHYWYTDETSGLPRSLEVTPELTRYWQDQGSKMLSSGLTVPVPCEHDFSAHPMTPKDKLLNNAGWIKEYRVKQAPDGRKDVLFGILDIQDPEVARKLPGTIRWTSPWINSFTDGNGNKWNNVISHLALTTRPRITKQTPFSGIAAALSLSTAVSPDLTTMLSMTELQEGGTGIVLTKAGRLVKRKKDGKLRPKYPVAFSLVAGGIKLSSKDNMKPLKEDGEEMEMEEDEKFEKKGGEEDKGSKGEESEEGDDFGSEGAQPFMDSPGDVKMEELLSDLLCALGVMMPENVGESEFKRALYEATMCKVKELTSKGLNPSNPNDPNNPNPQPNNTSPAGQHQNPLIQQEQQPMHMSLEDINNIVDPTVKTIALSMHAENLKLHALLEEQGKATKSLQDAKLKEASAVRQQRVTLIGKVSPKAKTDLEAMLALPSMALSMGDGGAVIDPMQQTLQILEKGLADMPRLLTTDTSAFSVQPQPRDGDEMTNERADEIADKMARMMGASPLPKSGAA